MDLVSRVHVDEESESEEYQREWSLEIGSRLHVIQDIDGRLEVLDVETDKRLYVDPAAGGDWLVISQVSVVSL